MLASSAVSPLGNSSHSSSPCIRRPALRCRAHRRPPGPVRCLPYILALSSTLCRLSEVPPPRAKTHPPEPDLPSQLPSFHQSSLSSNQISLLLLPRHQASPTLVLYSPLHLPHPRSHHRWGVDLVDHCPAAAGTPSCVLFSARLSGPSGNFHLGFEQLLWLLQGCPGRQHASQAEDPF